MFSPWRLIRKKIYATKAQRVDRLENIGWNATSAGVGVMDAIDELRTDPQNALSRWRYYLGSTKDFDVRPGDGRLLKGGNCDLDMVSGGRLGKDNIPTVKLRVKNPSFAHGDLSLKTWYFPYLGGHVGTVAVPAAVADGTIAITPAMNGCALEVIQVGPMLHFYHDSNGNCLRKTVLPVEGVRLCRVEYGDYAPDQVGDSVSSKGVFFFYQLLVVKRNGAWNVVTCGFTTGANDAMLGSFTEKNSSLVASFTAYDQII
jgi:hypothetical protein